MKHEFKHRVYYSDTDAYGVVWHGNYLRWMEMARVEFCRELNIDLVELKKQDIVIPVTDIKIRYKSSAKLDDNILVTTTVTKITPLSATFEQIIQNAETKTIYTKAQVEVVAVNNEGILYRRLPDILKTTLEGAM
ncbi:YbgC/FadM family acyl-CoA thioesterase [bacterium]|nr:YbgC/FadM family acyl-CoA thioesterase [bacterium]